VGFIVVVAVLVNFMYVRIHGKSINVFDLFSASMGHKGGGLSSSSIWPDTESGDASSGSSSQQQQQQQPQRQGRGKAFKSIVPINGEEFKELEF
jgi:hypothetical protein